MTRKRDLTSGNILKNLLWVAIPTLLSSVVQMTYNLTDMYWVARVRDMGLSEQDAIAGVGTAGFYMWFGFGIIMLIKMGTSVKVSHATGANDIEKVSTYGNTGLILMGIVAIVYSMIGYFGAEVYANSWAFDSPDVVQYTIDYLSVISIFGISIFFINLFSGIYDGLGLTIMTFLVTAVGLFMNIILDPFFILDTVNIFGVTFNGLGLTVKGAAIATAISQGTVLLIYVTIYFGKKRPFDLNPFKYFKKDAAKEILRIGFPVALQSVLFTTIAVIVTRMQAEYGEGVVATQRLGSQIEALAWMIASGFQVALASFVGQNYGAGRLDRVKDGYITAMKLLVPYGIVINLFLFIFSSQLFGLFVKDPEFIELGGLYLKILSISQLFMIVELSTAGAFNGLGKTKYPSVVGIIGNLLRIPLAALLAVGLGYAGIWWAISISSIIKGVVLVLIFIYVFRKLLRVDTEKVEI